MEMITGGGCDKNSMKAAQAAQDAELKKSLKKIKYRFMVMSGKGGVGKTSVSVNLALALADKGLKVGIMDVDIHGPDVPRMLGIEKQMLGVNANKKLTPLECSENLSAVSIESLSPQAKDDGGIYIGRGAHWKTFWHTARFISTQCWNWGWRLGISSLIDVFLPGNTGD